MYNLAIKKDQIITGWGTVHDQLPGLQYNVCWNTGNMSTNDMAETQKPVCRCSCNISLKLKYDKKC